MTCCAWPISVPRWGPVRVCDATSGLKRGKEVTCLATVDNTLATLPFSRIAQRGEEGSRNCKLEFIAPEQKTNPSCWKAQFCFFKYVDKKEGGEVTGLPRADSIRSAFPFSIELFNRLLEYQKPSVYILTRHFVWTKEWTVVTSWHFENVLPKTC